MLRRIIVFTFLSILLFSSSSFFVSAFFLNEEEVSVESYYLYNFENDLVMAQKDINKTLNASSTVKIMSACVALEAGIPMNEVITISKAMLEGVSGRFMGLRVGDKMTFEDLLYSMICASFNDATHALACAVAGSTNEFVDMMNNKAIELGMSHTLYTDPTGISSTSKTSVSDIVKLVEYMINNDQYIKITSSKTYDLSHLATCDYNRISNRSALISLYKGFSNFNVGSSNESADCTVSYCNNGKNSFVCIVMNARMHDATGTENSAEACAKKLLNHGLYDYSVKTVIGNKKVLASIPVKYSISDDHVNLYASYNLDVFLSNEINIENGLSYNYYLFEDELKAPLSIGDEVGILIVSKNGKYIGSVPLAVDRNVDRNFFLYLMDSLKSYFSGRTFVISLVFFVFFCITYYIYKTQMLNKIFRRNSKSKVRYKR